MKEILVTAITTQGDAAINKHWGEFKRLPIRQRLIFKAMGYRHELLSDNPATILLTVNNRNANNSLFTKLINEEIIKGLQLNGALINTDYKIEFKNEGV